MTFSLVQSVGGSGTSKAYGSNNAAGNLLIACALNFGGSSYSVPTDSAGNTHWTLAAQTNGFQEVSVYIWYCWNSKAGANTVTFSATTNDLWIAEYSGVQSTSDPLDNGAAAFSGTGYVATASPAAVSISPLVSGDLCVAWGNVGNATPVAGTGLVSAYTSGSEMAEWGTLASAGAFDPGLLSTVDQLLIGQADHGLARHEGPIRDPCPDWRR